MDFLRLQSYKRRMLETPQKIRIHITYDGSRFGGWQKQKHDANTVQAHIEKALSALFGHPITLQASGRTDNGVHAISQVAHFETHRALDRYDLRRGFQRYLPPGIAITAAYLAPEDFHARYSAEKKEYIYRIYQQPVPCPFKERFFTYYPYSLREDLLHQYAEKICGDVDFSSFQNVGTPTKSNVRHIFEAKWSREQEILQFRVVGSGFLKQMVRNLVGSMLEYQRFNRSAEDFAELIALKDRRKAPEAASPNGLYLSQVSYPLELDKKCLNLYK